MLPVLLIVGASAYGTWKIHDLARFPDAAYEAIGESKSVWMLRALLPSSRYIQVRTKLLRWQDEQQGIENRKRKHVVPSPVLAILNFLLFAGIFFAVGLWGGGRPTASLLVGSGFLLAIMVNFRVLAGRMRRGDY